MMSERDGMTKQHKLRIVTDNRRGIFSVRVYDVASGNEIHDITSIQWAMEIGGVPKATITTLFAEIDVVTGGRVVSMCPRCKQEVADEQ